MHRYMWKMHLVSLNGRAIFLKMPANDKARISWERIKRYWNLGPRSCIRDRFGARPR